MKSVIIIYRKVNNNLFEVNSGHVQLIDSVFIIKKNNSLSDIVVTASSVNAFRKQLNAVNLEKFLIVG